VSHVAQVPLIIVFIGAMIAAVTDVWKFKVYNLLTIPLLASGLAYHAISGEGLASSALGMLFGFGILIVLHVMGGVGAGDVKLMAAIGAWLGIETTFYVFIASALAAGIYAVILVAFSGRVAEHLVNLQILVHRLMSLGKYLGADDRMEVEVNRADRRRRVIPFGAMVAVGFVAAICYLRAK
jgi:prepilin peptidase CpaA